MMNIHESLAQIQSVLKAPKNQFNSFGKYSYRSQEDILEAVKPLLKGLVLNISDEIVLIGDRYYVKATATITDGTASVRSFAFARESEAKTGMDSAQLTGSTSSYARKYALNGLFAIDDAKDADTMDNTTVTAPVKTENKSFSTANCSKCNAGITANESSYSKNKFGKELCMTCQKGVK
jgi:hypothetical protein